MFNYQCSAMPSMRMSRRTSCHPVQRPLSSLTARAGVVQCLRGVHRPSPAQGRRRLCMRPWLAPAVCLDSGGAEGTARLQAAQEALCPSRSRLAAPAASQARCKPRRPTCRFTLSPHLLHRQGCHELVFLSCGRQGFTCGGWVCRMMCTAGKPGQLPDYLGFPLAAPQLRR